MSPWPPPMLSLLALFVFLIHFSYSDPGPACPKTNTSLLNFTSHFTMVQHQLRGLFSVVDGCSFRVSQFDMLSGQDVHWWGAAAADFQNLTGGFPISDSYLNHTYKNDTFTVRLRDNVTWEQISVLSVWDIPTASDFGHLLLGKNSNPEPSTVFENCKTLSDNYRVRWSVKGDYNSIDIGLEAAIGTQNYMAFGWANPNSSKTSFMTGGDLAVTGFEEDGFPFAHDYYITKYSECMSNNDGTFQGVCPDTMYNSSHQTILVNNTRLLHGHRKDGVSFVRYRRPLKSNDKKYDSDIDPMSNMVVIWSIGLVLRPYYLPQVEGGSYGHLILNVSNSVNDCLGPLDAKDKQDQDIVIADKKEPLVVSIGPALHYPNPPNPPNVLYINKKEAPLLRVERGVPVKFSIQAGHDVAIYVTSDPLGGNATLRNMSEVIYFGGSEAEGVQADPTELNWAPDRNTPDLVYYQSLYVPKMGWKVQVVDGGLSDMYNNSVLLDDQQVMFFWTLSDSSISIAARGEKKSGYLAIGFGREMVNSYVYVGWVDENSIGRVNTYYIDGRNALDVHPTSENLSYTRCKSENGIITLEFTRRLNPSCDRNTRKECNNIIDVSTPLKVIWAMGGQWSDENLSVRNTHFVTSKRPMSVLLIGGSAEAEEDLRPVLAVHGFMMFLAWGILLPGGVMAARYLKQHMKDDDWYKIHVNLQWSGLAIVFLGFLFAVAEIRGLNLDLLHVKFGMAAILVVVGQPVNGYLRPGFGEGDLRKRVVWEYSHFVIGMCGLVLGVAALFTGMKRLGERYGDENVHGLCWALMVWFFLGCLTVIYFEVNRKTKKDGVLVRGSWVLGNSEEDDHLLNQSRVQESHPLERMEMEIQLEPLSR